MAGKQVVSKRRDLQAHAGTLGDLRDVLESIKNVAMAEIGKLSRTEPARRHMLEELTLIAAATAPYWPAAARAPQTALYLLVGSERGFCGDFNAEVARLWIEICEKDSRAHAIAVGSALIERLQNAPRIVAKLEGPAIVEDIDRTLVDAIGRIASVEKSAEPFVLLSVANGAGGVEQTAILPFEPPQDALSPVLVDLNLPPDAFVREFVDQYVDAALHSIFATSLLGENRARLAHMTVAVDRLDENAGDLRRRIHHLRQEEITQEVETILLSLQAAR